MGQSTRTLSREIKRPSPGRGGVPHLFLVLNCSHTASTAARISLEHLDEVLLGRDVARSAVPVIVRGESGTGKEVIASAIHQLSGRAGPFQAVNCGALPAALVESELLGYRKGTFTGADEDRVGVVRSAHGGTLFLDEIGDLPLAAQAALLRVLQE